VDFGPFVCFAVAHEPQGLCGGWGWRIVGEDKRRRAPPGSLYYLHVDTPAVRVRGIAPPPDLPEQRGVAREPAGDPAQPTPFSGKPAVDAGGPAPAEPSWGRVLATTIKLWVLRWLRPAGSGARGVSGRLSRNWFRRRPGHRRQLTARRWRLSAALVLALALITVSVLQFTGVLTGTASPAARASSPGSSPAGSAGQAGIHGTSSQAAAAQAEAAAWIAGQVSDDAIVACYPAMCGAVQAQGVAAGRLLILRPGAASSFSADVIVVSPSMGGRAADEDAPALIAGFGSGSNRIEVRATEPGGAAGYAVALRADLAARTAAGSQLLRNSHIQFTMQEAAQLRAGQVDSRLLATLAALASQFRFRVTAFGDASPGAQVLFREVTIASPGGGDGAVGLTAALALVRAQDPPYLPAHATIIHPGTGQAALSIEFAAPSPLGLLTTVLAADLRGAAARATAIGTSPLGQALIR
jgi:hypothetical protein